MSSDMKLRGDLILSLRARSTALEKLLEHLNCSIRGEVSRVQDRANFDICSSVLASNSHVVGSYTSCGTRAYNTQFQPVRIARVTQPRLHGKRPHLGIDQLPIITNQNCSVKKCQETSARSFGTSLKDTTAIDNAFDEIRNVYYIDSGEMRKRNSAAKCIETLVRCWLVRHRYNVFLEKIKVMQQSNAQRLLRAVSESAVRCRELDLGITRIMRRRCRKVLFKHWGALCTIIHGHTQEKIPLTQSIKFRHLQHILVSRGRVLKQAGLEKWRLVSFRPFPQFERVPHLISNVSTDGRLKVDHSFESVADTAVCTACHAAKFACSAQFECQSVVMRRLSIATRALTAATHLLQMVFRSWRRWCKNASEGRLALALNDPGYTALLVKDFPTSRGFKPRFCAPHDMQAAARISYCFRLRRYSDAWRSRTATLAKIALKRRRALTVYMRAQLSAWHAHATKLQAARRAALSLWRAHLVARLSEPLQAWYLWAHTRVAQRQDAERVVAAFARLKRRHMAAATLRAWRHAAELNRLEARYTRRQLMGALAEQKGHVRRLEQLVDDHDLARAELDNAADLAHERAAKLGRSASIRDDDCRFLEVRLENVEAGVAAAQRCLSSMGAGRSALTRHILRMQPVVGFTDRGLANLARNRDARLGAGVANSQQGNTSTDVLPVRPESDTTDVQTEEPTDNGEFSLANTISFGNTPEDGGSRAQHPETSPSGEADAQEEIIELPKGLVLIRHPNETGGLMLCRQSPINSLQLEAQHASGGTDVIKQAFATRLDWLLALLGSFPPQVEFRAITHVGNVPLFKSAKIRAAERDSLADDEGCMHVVDECNVTQPALSSHAFVPLRNVPHSTVDEAALSLLCNLEEMYGFFEFLRVGDTSALPVSLLASWKHFCPEDANFGAQNSLRWRELVHKAPPCGRLSTWADFTKHLNARLPRKRPSETKADQLAHAIVSSQARADMTCVALYSGGARYLRPNVYSAQVVRDQFEPAPMRLWDPVW